MDSAYFVPDGANLRQVIALGAEHIGDSAFYLPILRLKCDETIGDVSKSVELRVVRGPFISLKSGLGYLLRCNIGVSAPVDDEPLLNEKAFANIYRSFGRAGGVSIVHHDKDRDARYVYLEQKFGFMQRESTLGLAGDEFSAHVLQALGIPEMQEDDSQMWVERYRLANSISPEALSRAWKLSYSKGVCSNYRLLKSFADLGSELSINHRNRPDYNPRIQTSSVRLSGGFMGGPTLLQVGPYSSHASNIISTVLKNLQMSLGNREWTLENLEEHCHDASEAKAAMTFF